MSKIPKPFILFLIIVLCIFMRTWRYEDFYGFGHDQDLFAWIAKDIVIDKHIRLIGQETSINGLFIGPIFYYLISLALLFFNMDPRVANVVTVAVSLFTALSFYFVISKFFGKTAGLIISFLYSVSLGTALFDRWVVPTQPTLLWSIWYLYVLLSFLKGNFKVLPVLAILVGFIWHIHIAFAPLLLLLPLTIFLKRKAIRKSNFHLQFKNILLSSVIFFLLISPFLIFEVRHNFQQIKALTHVASEERGNVKGTARVLKIAKSAAVIFTGAFWYDEKQQNLPQEIFVIPLLALFFFIFLARKKVFDKEQVSIMAAWMGIGLIGQFISKRQISEYYLTNLLVIVYLTFALFIAYLYSFKKLRLPIILLLLFYVSFNIFSLLKLSKSYDNYGDRKRLIEYIKQDVLAHNYPCIGVNFIADPGAGVGFRYLFWLNKIPIIKPVAGIPVYNIAIPWIYASPKELSFKQGYFGVIIPKPIEVKNLGLCNDVKNQFLPLSGFVN
ncbi:MAG: glycosyltransferase family 39 protein [Candidatus Daviesbacteria bacterium]|nr:glycosyltransferase family 39 protein [Candidatus Daviesbacteria bacterium]